MTMLSEVIPIRSSRSYDGREHRWPYLFGVELELESVRFQGSRNFNPPGGWAIHPDASLREGLEFVSNDPMGGIQLDRAIRNFYDMNFEYTNGPRTSTHIHVNMSDATIGELRSMVALVYTIEDAIYATTEESRKWGGYSVALAEMRPLRLRNIMNAPSNRVFAQHIMPSRNNERYYGFNVNVSKHGTVEFRYFPGGPTQEELRSWIDLIALIRTSSKKHTVDSMIKRITSPEALEHFIRENLGEWGDRLINSRGISDMYANFETISAMATDDENPERGGGIVTVNNTLLKFVNETLLDNNTQAITYMKESLPRTGVLSEGDWKYYLGEAIGQANLAGRRERDLAQQVRVVSPQNFTYNTFGSAADPFADPVAEDDEEYDDDDEDIVPEPASRDTLSYVSNPFQISDYENLLRNTTLSANTNPWQPRSSAVVPEPMTARDRERVRERMRLEDVRARAAAAAIVNRNRRQPSF